MALPGSTPVAANSPKMMEVVREAGERIVQMVWDDLKPRDILTPGAFGNAVRAILAVGGSINSVKHMQAVASEAACDVDIYGLFEKLANETPVLTAVRPVGDHTIEEFEAAGGCRAVLKQLEPLLDGNVLTVTGKSLKENLAQAVIEDPEIVRPLSRPIATKPAIVWVRGSPAPEARHRDSGHRPAQGNAAFEASDLCFRHFGRTWPPSWRPIKAGHVVVMRGAGYVRGPGLWAARRAWCSAWTRGSVRPLALLHRRPSPSGHRLPGPGGGGVARKPSLGGRPLALVEKDPDVHDLEKARLRPYGGAAAELERRGASSLALALGNTA